MSFIDKYPSIQTLFVYARFNSFFASHMYYDGVIINQTQIHHISCRLCHKIAAICQQLSYKSWFRRNIKDAF